MTDDNFLKLLDKMATVNEKVSKISHDVGTLKIEVGEIHNEDRRQNDLLAEHILGVKTNSARLENEIQARKDALLIHREEHKAWKKGFEARIEKTEFFPNFLASAKKIIIWVGGISAAAYSIYKFVTLW